MEQHSETSGRLKSRHCNQNDATNHFITILKRYTAGEISAREAAKALGPNATEHDIFAGVIAEHLSLPQPNSEELAIQVSALRALYNCENYQ